MYFDTNEKKDCCGCTACYSICPKNAISMKPDRLGFLYPEIDTEKCINCNLCRKVCSFKKEYDISDNITPRFFAVRHKNMEEILKSRSGAAFIGMSDWILDQNGVIYGAGYGEHFKVVHKRAASKQERDEFRGSKYVQSDLGDVFSGVIKDLDDGKYVMFSGTGCQTAGLKSFLKIKKIDDEKLFLIDIVCHGVPSPYFWDDYLSFIEKKYGSEIVKVNFRDKKFGWKSHIESFYLKDGSIISTNTFSKTYYQHLILRKSCGVCYYTNTTRPSDLSLADFWGWEKVNPDLNKDDNGISLIIVNTKKGLDLFQKINSTYNYFETDMEKSLQPHLKEPTKLNVNSDAFEKYFREKSFIYILRRYCEYGTSNRIKRGIKKLLKKLIGKK